SDLIDRVVPFCDFSVLLTLEPDEVTLKFTAQKRLSYKTCVIFIRVKNDKSIHIWITKDSIIILIFRYLKIPTLTRGNDDHPVFLTICCSVFNSIQQFTYIAIKS